MSVSRARVLAALAATGPLEEALTAVAIDGNWLRAVVDGQVKLFGSLVMETLRNIGISLLRLAGITQITRTL